MGLLLILFVGLMTFHFKNHVDSGLTKFDTNENKRQSYGYNIEDSVFQRFIGDYRKNYHPIEYKKRSFIFKETLKRISWLNKHRKHKNSAVYGITEFSDLTPQEFHDRVIRKWQPIEDPKHLEETSNIRKRREIADYKKILGIPQKIDWRDHGIVSSVRNQDKCGACWAFSTVQTIESMNAKKGLPLEALSVQQVIDCSEGNHGCDGGDTCAALKWMANNKVPLSTEKAYPFKDGTDGVCGTFPQSGVVINANYTCDNYTGEEVEILKLLANHGPVVAAVDASGWQDYLGGIIQYHCDTQRNHAVQIVGYDLTGDVPFYIVRNSWGTRFGIQGYLHIAIGNNLCAISEEISALSVI